MLAICISGCAKRGSITGGSKDTIPPVLINSVPKNFSTGFKGNSIRLTFDEYIKLKDINKQLIVSPPMDTEPIITPTTASRYITIKINDTLQPNTTYSFNFGQSIQDNNESNPYPLFKYVFSTGTYIDSLTLGGKIRDAYSATPDNFVSIMLYEVGENYSDSIIYKQVPRYITNTLDSLKTFNLDYLKAGKYRLIALKDNNNNNRYDPKKDKIGFITEFVTIPTDTLYQLELFKEELPFKAIRPTQVSGNRIVMGFEGKPKDIDIALRNGNEIVPSIVTQLKGKDSVQVWYAPVKTDSLQLTTLKGDYRQEFTVRMRAQQPDTLSFSAEQSGTLPLRNPLSIVSSKPLVMFDDSKISVLNKDSTAVGFARTYDAFTQKVKIDFEKEPLEKYTVKLLPGALTDFYEETNDTLIYNFSTKNSSEYANMRINLLDVDRFPLIVELTNSKGDVIASQYTKGETVIEFLSLEPMIYTLRAIYDDNENKEWDAGNFLEQRQSEQVIYFPAPINIRANWDWIEQFSLR